MPTGATKDVSSIAAGYAHGLDLKSNGTVVCWPASKQLPAAQITR